jgi:hypothetical protein
MAWATPEREAYWDKCTARHIAWRDADEAGRIAMREASIAEGKRLADSIRRLHESVTEPMPGSGNETLSAARVAEAERLVTSAREIFNEMNDAAAALTALARRLMRETDPDAVRAGLTQIADVLARFVQPQPEVVPAETAA